MLSGLLGRKIGMTQLFAADGTAIPVTVIEAGPCTVTQIRTVARDGYDAVQIGFGTKSIKHATRAELGHLGHTLPLTPMQRRAQQQQQAKARAAARARAQTGEQVALEEGVETQTMTATKPRPIRPGPALGPFAVLREVKRLDDAPVQVGQVTNVSMFRVGEVVDVIGTSKGKGFQGVVKRHGFRGGPKTHGQSDRWRAPGSIGSGTTPGRVLKGTRMAGHMGNRRVTIKGLEVVEIDPARNLLVVKGSVPGAPGGLVMIRKKASAAALIAKLPEVHALEERT
jgi:large subunit ribosomal protein L3